MYLTTQGLVLRVTDYNDHDALLTLLTPNYGKLTVKARGLRRRNSPLIAPCQLLAYGSYTLFEYKGMYTINEAASIELFQTLRRDITKLSLGTYFCQVAEVLSQEDLPNPELLSLTLNCLHAVSSLNLPENAVKAVFEFRSACLQVICRIFPPAISVATKTRIGLTFRRVAWNAAAAEAMIQSVFVCR